MTNLENLIEEIGEKCIKLEEEYKEYEEVITVLCSKFQDHMGWTLALRYLSDSYNGRKICFYRDKKHENLKPMIMTLITTGRMENFLEYLTTEAIPLHKNSQMVKDFFF